MSANSFVLRSSIKPDLLKKILLKGTCLAGLGVLILFLTGAFMPESYLAHWGLLFFGISMLLIAAGLIPYRRLQKLENNPDKIVVTEDHILHYIRNKREVFEIPLQSIQSLKWIDNKTIYGIGAFLNEEEARLIPKQFRQNARKKFGADLFFPFFSKHAFSELQELLTPDL